MLKIPLWLLTLILIFLIIFSVIYGSLIVQHYEYGTRYPRLEKVIIKISKYPIEIRQKLLFGGGLPDNSK
tara:strand:+ start:123 stop:332 length:210 start_codon:yes stop_codon:yes gene_type:complete